MIGAIVEQGRHELMSKLERKEVNDWNEEVAKIWEDALGKVEDEIKRGEVITWVQKEKGRKAWGQPKNGKRGWDKSE